MLGAFDFTPIDLTNPPLQYSGSSPRVETLSAKALFLSAKLRRELSSTLSADMRREAALALAEVRLTVTARPAVRSGGHSFAESQIFGSR
jgi:hypothetical protein